MSHELIAETDESGRVLWVWIKEKGASRVRPARDLPKERKLLEGAKCHGAAPESLRRWFSERLAEGHGAARR